jgi:hypothetical protein
MLKMKHLVVAAILILTAAVAFAADFRAADQLYVPLAGHVIGGGRLFITDLFIQNVENEAIDISYIYIPLGSTTPQYIPASGAAYSLAAGERREVVDVMVKTLAQGGLGLTGSPFGAVIVNVCRQGGNCTDPDPTTGADPDFRDATVFTRTYSVLASAPNPQQADTFGQAFPGFPWYSFASMTTSGSPSGDLNKVYITGLRATGAGAVTGTYRTNIGLMNASQFSDTTIQLKLYRGNLNTQVGTTSNRSLGPLQPYQNNITNEFGITAGTDMTNLFVVAEQISSTPRTDIPGFPAGCSADGCPGFFAFASILDNVTGDAVTLEGAFGVPLPDAALTEIYGSKPGGSPMLRRTIRRSNP